MDTLLNFLESHWVEILSTTATITLILTKGIKTDGNRAKSNEKARYNKYIKKSEKYLEKAKESAKKLKENENAISND